MKDVELSRDEKTQIPFATRLWSGVDIEVCLFSFLALTAPFYRVLPNFWSSIWLLTVLTIILVGVLTRNVSWPIMPAVWVFSLFAVIVAIMTATNEATVRNNLMVGVQLIGFMGLGVFVLTNRLGIKRVLLIAMGTSFAVAQTVSSAAAAVQVLGLPILGYGQVNGRSPGLNGHPNVLGLMSGVAILLCLSMVWRRNGTHTRVAIAGLVANSCGLIASGSLSALTSVIIGIFVLAWSRRMTVRNIGLTTLAIGGASLMLVALSRHGYLIRTPLDRFLQVTGQTSAESSVEIRGSTYEFAIARIQQSPVFGSGLDANTALSFNGLNVVHNFVLRAWYQGGALLGIASIAIVLSVVVLSVRAIASGTNAIPASILVTVTSFSLTSAFFEQGYYWAIFLVSFAAIEPLNRSRKSPGSTVFRNVRDSGLPTAQPVETFDGFKQDPGMKTQMGLYRLNSVEAERLTGRKP